MKILFDYQIFLSQRYGGPSRYFIELNKNLNQNKIESRIVSPFYINKYLKDEKGNFIKKNFYIYKKFKLNSLFKFLNEKFTENFINKDKIDIIHPTYYDLIKYQNLKIPKILTVYDLTHEKFPEFYGLPKNNKIKQEALNIANYYLCPSECTKKDLIEIYNIDEKKIFVVYWAPFLKKNINIFNQNIKDNFILFVGNRHKYKNAYKFLEAFYTNKFLKENYKIIFFGGGNFNSYEKELIKKFKFENKVKLVTGSDEKLIELYQKATLMVYPSLYEGLGLPILEAMVHGCPVATSYSSGMIEAGGNAVEFFDPNSIQSISASIMKIVDSLHYSNNLIKLGFEHVKNFTWLKCTKETFNIYKKII
jgi:glycosyltransferase involved in cell wall biosynthesis